MGCVSNKSTQSASSKQNIKQYDPKLQQIVTVPILYDPKINPIVKRRRSNNQQGKEFDQPNLEAISK